MRYPYIDLRGIYAHQAELRAEVARNRRLAALSPARRDASVVLGAALRGPLRLLRRLGSVARPAPRAA